MDTWYIRRCEAWREERMGKMCERINKGVSKSFIRYMYFTLKEQNTNSVVTYHFVVKHRYSTIERYICSGLNSNVFTLSLKMWTPTMVMIVLMFVERAVRVEYIIQHRWVCWHWPFRCIRAFGQDLLSRWWKICNKEVKDFRINFTVFMVQ